MRERQQSSTTHPISFLLVLASDHLTGATGITPTVTISKDGGSFASPSGAVSEIGSGWYSLAGNATDRATLGSFLLHATGTGCDPTDRDYTIVGYDPFDSQRLGLLVLPSSGTLAVNPTVGNLGAGAKTDAENAVWNAVRSSHTTLGSYGTAIQVIREGTAQAGSTNTITLDSGASATTGAYIGATLLIISGTGVGQAQRTIVGYNPISKVATVSPAFSPNPDVTTGFLILPEDSPVLGSDGRVLVSADAHTAGATVTAGTVGDKTGYALSAAGLDAIAITDPGGVSGQTTFPKLLVALYRRFMKKTTLTATQLRTYADDGTTVNTTQAVSDDGTTQTQGTAT